MGKVKSYMRWSRLGALLLAIVVLAACSSGKDEEGTDLQVVDLGNTSQDANDTANQGAPSPLTNVPAPPLDRKALPEVADLPGQLLIAHGTSLYLGAFDGQPLHELANLIGTGTVSPSPDGQCVAYSNGSIHAIERQDASFEFEEYVVLVTDLATFENQPIIPENAQRMRNPMPIGGWIDNEHLIIWGSRTIYLAYLEHNFTFEWSPMPIVAWLDGGTLLTWIMPENMRDPEAELKLAQFDPATREYTPADFTAPLAPFPDFFQLEPELQTKGYTYAANFTDYGRSVLLSSGERVYIAMPDAARIMNTSACDTWSVVQSARDGSTPTETLYETEAATFISDLSLLPDGSVLFLQWTFENCNLLADMRVELLRLQPGSAPEVVTDEIDPGKDGNLNSIRMMAYQRGHKYSVSADGRYVFWVGRTADSIQSQVRVTDLDANITAPVLATTVAQGTGHIEGVFWVPSSTPTD